MGTPRNVSTTHIRDVATARRVPPAFVTIVSTARAHSRRTTSSRPQEFAKSRVQREQTRKTVRLRCSGSRDSVHTVRATTKERDMQHGAPVHPGRCTHTSEHARAVHAQILATLVPTTSETHGTRPLRSTAVAIAPLPLPACLKRSYHSRKMTTRRYDFRHQSSTGCTYSSSAVLRTPWPRHVCVVEKLHGVPMFYRCLC